MANAMDAPTIDRFRMWRDELNGDWNRGAGRVLSLEQQMKDEEDLYFQRFPIDSPQGRMPVKTGSAPSDADAAVDSIVPNDVSVKVHPAKNNKKYKDQAEMLSLFGKGLIRHWRRKKDLLRLMATDMVVRRVGIARVLVDDTVWSQERPKDLGARPKADQDAWEITYRRRIPIVLERRNPRYVRWRDDDAGNLLVVVESFRTTVLQAQLTYENYPAAQNILKNLELNQSIQIDDIWYLKWRCILIENQPIFPVGTGKRKGIGVHGYDRVPYVLAPFRELGFDNPGERYRGMLTNAAGLYPIESQVLTMHVWMLAWNAWRTWVSWTADGRALEILPGQNIPIDKQKGEYIEMLQGQPVPPELLQTASVMDSYIQRNGVAQGPRTQEGTRSAQQVWAIQAIRQLKVDAAKAALQSALEDALSLAAEHLQNYLKEDLTLPVPGRDADGNEIGYVKIKWQDIQGYTDAFEVAFGRRMDPAMLEQAKALMTLAINNWMPLQESWLQSGMTDNPQEWEDALLLQGVNRQDFLLQLAGLEQVKEYYGEQSPQYQATLQRFIQAKQMEQQGAGVPTGGGMQPTGGPKGPAATGEAGPSSMAPPGAPRVTGNTPPGAPPGLAAGSPPGQNTP